MVQPEVAGVSVGLKAPLLELSVPNLLSTGPLELPR